MPIEKKHREQNFLSLKFTNLNRGEEKKYYKLREDSKVLAIQQSVIPVLEYHSIDPNMRHNVSWNPDILSLISKIISLIKDPKNRK